MTETQARIGIFGGTFNPVHIGHLRAAEEVVDALRLERMIFVPSADPPHKIDIPGDRIAPAKARLKWVKLAIHDNPRFEAFPPRLRAARGIPRFLPLNDSRKNVSSASAIPVR